MTGTTGAPGTVRVTGLLVSDVDSTFLTQEVIELVAEHAGVSVKTVSNIRTDEDRLAVVDSRNLKEA